MSFSRLAEDAASASKIVPLSKRSTEGCYHVNSGKMAGFLKCESSLPQKQKEMRLAAAEIALRPITLTLAKALLLYSRIKLISSFLKTYSF